MTRVSNSYRDILLAQIVRNFEDAMAYQLFLHTGREWRWNGNNWVEIPKPNPTDNGAAETEVHPAMISRRYSDYEAIRAYEEFGDGVFEPDEDPAPAVPF